MFHIYLATPEAAQGLVSGSRRLSTVTELETANPEFVNEGFGANSGFMEGCVGMSGQITGNSCACGSQLQQRSQKKDYQKWMISRKSVCFKLANYYPKV